MKRNLNIFLVLILLLLITGCSGNKDNPVHTREEYLKDIYSEFTEPYIVDRIKYRITPDNTGEIMRYVSQCDITFNKENSTVLKNSVRAIYRCMENSRITDLHQMNTEQWNALEQASKYFASNLELSTEYIQGTGIEFKNSSNETAFIIANLSSEAQNSSHYGYYPYHPYSPYFYGYY